MSSVWSFAFLWCFESLAAGAATEELKEGKRHAALSADRAERLLDFAHFSHFHASLAIQPRANESHIMSEDRCQISLNLLGSNDLFV